ncbi:Uncharacterised protein [Budvicia aquatica]|uniref:Uncharacterized protein n=2 Tax=Budvicia aquatica TaxID=82979 RepID=A0A484ZIF0_9GAMM|nr:Uncharacterised protein [Budvicia aquatica]
MLGGDTLLFLGQFYAAKSKLMNQYFGSGQSIYLFTLASGDTLKFQAFMQDTSEQTAEDHYRLEEQMMAFDSHYKHIDEVEILIKAGDKYLHQYIAEHKRSGKEILTVLLQYAKTKVLNSRYSSAWRWPNLNNIDKPTSPNYIDAGLFQGASGSLYYIHYLAG